jgi:uncharacterized LabA/DUF88 family protein
MAREGVSLLAVLIDADNVLAKHAEAILKEVTRFGEPALRRVYGDWSSAQLAGWKAQARDLGLVMHQQSANTKGKNASDIGLVIDAMDILHAGKFDGFVLVSSDSDFTRLASRIREDGLEVIGIGEAKTPEALRKVCNVFVLIENIVGEAESPARQPKSLMPAMPVAQDVPEEAPRKLAASKAIPFIRAAMKKLDPDGEWYELGTLKQSIVKDNPDFDERTYGCGKFSDLLQKTGRFEVKMEAGRAPVVRDMA